MKPSPCPRRKLTIIITTIIAIIILALAGLFYMQYRINLLNSYDDTAPDIPPSSQAANSNAESTTPDPVFIDFPTIIHVTQGAHGLNLLSGITATSSDNNPVELTINGDYDPDQLGTYALTYLATNTTTGQQTTQPLTIVVTSDYVVGGKRVWQGTFTTPKGFPVEIRDGVTYVNGTLIANKSNPVPASYAPGITPETTAAFEQMRQAAARDGINLTIQSGFRSYTTQQGLYDYYVNRDGFAAAETYSSRAGYSEHQTGLALDLNWVDNDFVYTPAAKWLDANAYKYGFILRYLQNAEDLTGFMFEPWHFRYVGTDFAEILYNDGNWISIEEYFGLKSEYDEQGNKNF